MALFTTGQPLTAAELNVLGLYAAKTADQSVTSSTTLVNDTHLSVALPVVGTYLFDLWLYGASAANAAGDLSVGFSFPAGTCMAGGIGPDVSLASGNAVIGQFGVNTALTSGGVYNAYGLSTGVTLTYLHVNLTVTATGTFQLMWAQSTSNASASTLKAGSHMLGRQVA